MSPDDPSSKDPALVWGEDGLPRSGRFGDVYFSSDDGLAETRAVFLQGCGLPEAWRGRRRFVVGELGFGTGLNIAALLDLWRQERPRDGWLHIFTVEAFPVSREDAARALGRWPELSAVSDRLLARWPGRGGGFHRVDLPELAATLDLAVMEAGEALRQWRGRADAWFLDGFAPASNPQMWRQDVLDQVLAKSAPGARAATFTVAGAVRRCLQLAGFEVEKRPGFGRKRERLEARRPGGQPEVHGRSVAIIGAGIAGASLARAFRANGVEPVLFDDRGPGGGASGNPAGLVTPRLDAGLGPAARLYAQSFRRAVDLISQVPDAVIARGALQLAADDRDRRRFAAIAASDLFEPGDLEIVDDGLVFRDGLVIEPAKLLAAWLGDVRRETVAAIAVRGDRFALLDARGRTLARANQVCIAAGHRSAAFAPDLTLQPIRGQVSWAAEAALDRATSGKGYAIPTRNGVLFGATFDRDDEREDVRADDDARNLALLRATLPPLAAEVGNRPLASRAAIRAATRDRLPLCGLAEPGIAVLSGLGSRGFCTAPLLAEDLASTIGSPSPLPACLAAVVEPGRFAERDRRRASP